MREGINYEESGVGVRACYPEHGRLPVWSDWERAAPDHPAKCQWTAGSPGRRTPGLPVCGQQKIPADGQSSSRRWTRLVGSGTSSFMNPSQGRWAMWATPWGCPSCVVRPADTTWKVEDQGGLGQAQRGPLGDDEVGVVEQPVDAGGGQGLGHGRVQVAGDGEAALLV